MRVAWPTRTPGTSVIASNGPGCMRPILIRRSAARVPKIYAYVAEASAVWLIRGETDRAPSQSCPAAGSCVLARWASARPAPTADLFGRGAHPVDLDRED